LLVGEVAQGFFNAVVEQADAVSAGAKCRSNADVRSQLNADARCPS
jgi:hypothetical protein